MRPPAPTFDFSTREPRITARPDALISLPVRRFSCTRLVPRKSVLVDATTATGARLEGSHRLRVMPDKVVVVQVELSLDSKGLC